ncbi:MAG: tail fiber domain-containing protein [Bacteroidota bacterium]
MKKLPVFLQVAFYGLLILSPGLVKSFSQNVGIGTTAPNANAVLHVNLGASTTKGFLVTGTYNAFASMPDLGAGSRLMFYPGKAAFRAGQVDGVQWNDVYTGTNSTAIGVNTTASGPGSISLGSGTNASGGGAAAIGYNASANGYASTATGFTTAANGYVSTALGNFSIANGAYATAIGNHTVAGGDHSTAAGYYTSAPGNTATAMGEFTTASGLISTAIGSYTRATGYVTFAAGRFTTARSEASTALGVYSTAKGYASTVVGMYNDSMLAVDENAATAGTPLFMVGNGDIGNRSNAMVVRKDGNIGIGANYPAGRMHIRTNSELAYPQLLLEENQNDYVRLSFTNYATSLFWTIAALPQPSAAASVMNFYFNGYGDVLSLKGNGNATLNGVLTQTSDSRLKTNIHPLKNSLQKLTQLNGYAYNWLNPQMDNGEQIGVLAQEVKALFPQLVKEDDKGTLSVNYQGLVPVLIQSVKEQQQEIEEMKRQIGALQKLVVKN